MGGSGVSGACVAAARTPAKSPPPLFASGLQEDKRPDRSADECGTVLDGKTRPGHAVLTDAEGLRVTVGDALMHPGSFCIRRPTCLGLKRLCVALYSHVNVALLR